MVHFLDLTINGLMLGGLYALLAVSIVLVFKATSVVSLAHGQILAFAALAFCVAFVWIGLPLWLSLLLCLIIGAVLGFVVERFCLRPLIGQSLFSAFLMTFAVFMVLDGIFQLILKGVAQGFPDFLPTGQVYLGSITIPVGQLVSFGISLIVFLLLALFFRYTKLGLGMRATAEDHQLAQSAGISVKTIFSMVWIISSVAAAVAGLALARVMDVHYPLPWLGVKGLVVALFGGLDSLPGALVAGLVLGVLETIGSGYLDPFVGGGVKEVAAYVVLLFILLIRPYGLFGLARIERI